MQNHTDISTLLQNYKNLNNKNILTFIDKRKPKNFGDNNDLVNFVGSALSSTVLKNEEKSKIVKLVKYVDFDDVNFDNLISFVSMAVDNLEYKIADKNKKIIGDVEKSREVNFYKDKNLSTQKVNLLIYTLSKLPSSKILELISFFKSLNTNLKIIYNSILIFDHGIFESFLSQNTFQSNNLSILLVKKLVKLENFKNFLCFYILKIDQILKENKLNLEKVCDAIFEICIYLEKCGNNFKLNWQNELEFLYKKNNKTCVLKAMVGLNKRNGFVVAELLGGNINTSENVFLDENLKKCKYLGADKESETINILKNDGNEKPLESNKKIKYSKNFSCDTKFQNFNTPLLLNENKKFIDLKNKPIDFTENPNEFFKIFERIAPFLRKEILQNILKFHFPLFFTEKLRLKNFDFLRFVFKKDEQNDFEFAEFLTLKNTFMVAEIFKFAPEDCAHAYFSEMLKRVVHEKDLKYLSIVFQMHFLSEESANLILCNNESIFIATAIFPKLGKNDQKRLIQKFSSNLDSDDFEYVFCVFKMLFFYDDLKSVFNETCYEILPFLKRLYTEKRCEFLSAPLLFLEKILPFFGDKKELARICFVLLDFLDTKLDVVCFDEKINSRKIEKFNNNVIKSKTNKKIVDLIYNCVSIIQTKINVVNIIMSYHSKFHVHSTRRISGLFVVMFKKIGNLKVLAILISEYGIGNKLFVLKTLNLLLKEKNINYKEKSTVKNKSLNGDFFDEDLLIRIVEDAFKCSQIFIRKNACILSIQILQQTSNKVKVGVHLLNYVMYNVFDCGDEVELFLDCVCEELGSKFVFKYILVGMKHPAKCVRNWYGKFEKRFLVDLSLYEELM